MDLACDLVLEMDFHTELSENFHLAECEVQPKPTFCRGHIARLSFSYIKDCIQTSLFCPRDTSCFLIMLVLGLNVSFGEKL